MGKTYTPAELDDHRAKIADGLARIAMGTSIQRSARESGLPLTTLYDNYQKVLRDGNEDDKSTLDALVMSQVHDNVRLSGAIINDRLRHDGDKMTVADLNRINGTGLDKVAMHRAWGRGPQETGASLANLAATLLGGGSGSLKLTLEVDKGDDAIDVTPVPDDD